MLAAVMLCTACTDAAESALSGTESIASQSAQTSSAASDEETAQGWQSAVSEQTAASEQSAENPQTEDTEQTEQSAQEESADEVQETPEEQTATEPTADEQTQTSQTVPVPQTDPPAQTEPQSDFEESVPQSEFVAEETQTAQAKPPVQVVIPMIVAPSSPKTAAFVEDNGYIDYSNAAQGYIGVCYTGSSDRAKLRMICGGTTYDHDVTIGGVDYFPLSCGSGSYTLQLYEHAEGKMYALVIDKTVTLSVNSELNAFLQPNHYVWFEQSSECVEKSAELCAGAQGDVEKIAAIFGWLTENISYDKELAATVQSGYCPNPDRTLSLKKGICFDYASLFAAMTRAQGIPSRLVVGYAADNIYHAWNEVYTDETGWITPQLLLKNKGYNIVDATFYASAADKGAISEYISNNGNYAAIYYY